MKFSLTSKSLAVAIMVATAGWMGSHYWMAKRLESIQIESAEFQKQEVIRWRCMTILDFAFKISEDRDAESLGHDATLMLVSEFDRLAKSSQQTDGDFFAENYDAAGKILYYFGWDCETPDQLKARLKNCCEMLRVSPPSLLPNEFLTNALEVKSKLRREAGSDAPQKSITPIKSIYKSEFP